MREGGRISAAALRADTVLIPGVREPAPDDLEPDAAALWNAVIARLPADWFTTENKPLFKAYCRHATYADYFAKQATALRATIESLEASGTKAAAKKLPKLRERFITAHKMHAFEIEHATSVATKLRLTNQSRYVRQTAGNKARSESASNPPPWQKWGTTTSQHPDA